MTTELEPGPMRVEKGVFATKEEAIADLNAMGYFPTTYVSDLMDELPPHWHDFDNVGYVIEGKSYVLDGEGERVPLEAGDKLVIPRGAVHAEGAVTERMVYIVGLPMAANLFVVLIDFKDPASSPLHG